MAVKSKSEEIILKLLENNNAMTIEEIFHQLSQQENKELSERIIKETVWNLLEKGKIRPNKQWKMELNLSNDM